LAYNGDQLSWNNFTLGRDEAADITFRTRVDPSAPPGTEICNYGLVTYVEAEEGGPIGGVPSRWAEITRNADGLEEPECVVVASGVLLVDSSKTMTDADGDGFIEAGEQVDIEIRVRNSGSGDATAVVVTDGLPPGLVPTNAGEGGVISGNTVTWDETTTPALARVRPAEDAVLTLQAVAECTGIFVFCNQALMTAAEIDFDVPTGDPSMATPSQPTCLAAASPSLATSSLLLTEQGGDGIFAAGESVLGEVTVINDGNSDAASVEVRLPLPACLIDPVPLSGGTFGAGEITWDSAGTPGLSTISVGASTTVSFRATVDPAAIDGATCCAQAQLAPLGCPEVVSDDAATPAPADPSCFGVSAEPQLALRLRATDPDGDGVLAAGELLEFEVEVESLGGAPAAMIDIQLPLPAGHFTAEEADAGEAATDLLRWDATTEPGLLELAPGETVTLSGRAQLTCAVGDGDRDCLVARLVAANLGASLDSDDPDLPGSADETCVDLATPLLSASTLAATEPGGDGSFDRGEVITLSVDFTNSGSSAAGDLLVELPVTADDLELTPGQGGRVDPDAVRWDASTTPELASLAPGESVHLELNLRIAASAAGRACRQASVSWPAGGCTTEISHDPLLAGDDLATCWDVAGSDQPPAEVPDGDVLDAGPVPVRLTCEGDDLLLEWDAAADALTHVVYRGPMDSFTNRPWTNPAGLIDDPENAGPSCELLVLSYRDAGECATGGEDLYFLVAGRNLIGEGPLGEMRRGAMLEERPAVVAPCP
jgi:uncharacterized repeat protein (TIGR01451 family)